MKKSVLILILFFVSAQNINACSCEDEETISESVKSKDVIFKGQVVSISIYPMPDSLGILIIGDTSTINTKWLYYPTALVKIKLDKSFKGHLTSDTLTILTPLHDASCGFQFRIGQTYLVYATIYDELVVYNHIRKRSIHTNTFWTNACTWTREWNLTEENEIIKETIPDK